MKSVCLILLGGFVTLSGTCGGYVIAKTPPMGWNSWNGYHCGISEGLIKQVADLMVAKGLKDAGYSYLNLDDCWMASERDSNGTVLADSKTFPSGMKALANYVHDKGLLFGLYTSANLRTCANRAGSWKHELQDAATYCDWGIDFLKVDHCGPASTTNGYPHMNQSWILLRQGFDTCYRNGGRPMVLSVEYCTAPEALSQCVPWFVHNGKDHLKPCEQWVQEASANMWRVASDIGVSTSKILENAGCSSSLQYLPGHWRDGSGHWNDLDMLEIGNGLSPAWERIHFSLWCVLAAPLLISTDLSKLSEDQLTVLTNPRLIAVNQDPLGKPGRALFQTGPGKPVEVNGVSVWTRTLQGGAVAVLVVNTGNSAKNTKLYWTDLGLESSANASIDDLWSGKSLGTFTGEYEASVGPTDGYLMMKLTPGTLVNI